MRMYCCLRNEEHIVKRMWISAPLHNGASLIWLRMTVGSYLILAQGTGNFNTVEIKPVSFWIKCRVPLSLCPGAFQDSKICVPHGNQTPTSRLCKLQLITKLTELYLFCQTWHALINVWSTLLDLNETFCVSNVLSNVSRADGHRLETNGAVRHSKELNGCKNVKLTDINKRCVTRSTL